MSLGTSFSGSKRALRRGALALAVAGVVFAGSVSASAYAQEVPKPADITGLHADCGKCQSGTLMPSGSSRVHR